MLFLSINPLIIIFYYYQRIKNYRWKIHQQNIFICDSIDKLITDRMIVQIPTKNSIGKYKDCGSDHLDNWAIISESKV
jgi:hypothetical protein